MMGFENRPAVSGDTGLSKDALLQPGSYNTIFSLFYVTRINAELEKTREYVKDARNGMAVSGELLGNEFEEELRKASEGGVDIESVRKENDFLKRDLKTARGLEEHYKDELHKLQLAIANERSRHRREVAAMRTELSAIKNHASSSKPTRPPGSPAEKDTDNALLPDQLRLADQEMRRLRYGGSLATDAGQSALRSRQFVTNNAKLMEALELARGQPVSCEMANRRIVSELRRSSDPLKLHSTPPRLNWNMLRTS
jgi:hypothetical protein